jgi:hypothetical protein
MSVAMVGRMRDDFAFVVRRMMRERGSVFWLICAQFFGEKELQRGIWINIACTFFFMNI